jgi:hypothetical protein
VTGGYEGAIETRQDLLRAADRVAGHGRERVGNTQDMEWHGSGFRKQRALIRTR